MTAPIDALPAIHPGRMLRDELDAHGVDSQAFSEAIDVPQEAVADILDGARPITANMALRLAEAFGVSAQYWLNLQAIYDAKVAAR